MPGSDKMSGVVIKNFAEINRQGGREKLPIQKLAY
jgi:hypothetical protein